MKCGFHRIKRQSNSAKEENISRQTAPKSSKKTTTPMPLPRVKNPKLKINREITPQIGMVKKPNQLEPYLDDKDINNTSFDNPALYEVDEDERNYEHAYTYVR